MIKKCDQVQFFFSSDTLLLGKFRFGSYWKSSTFLKILIYIEKGHIEKEILLESVFVEEMRFIWVNKEMLQTLSHYSSYPQN